MHIPTHMSECVDGRARNQTQQVWPGSAQAICTKHSEVPPTVLIFRLYHNMKRYRVIKQTLNMNKAQVFGR